MHDEAHWRCKRNDNDRIHVVTIGDRVYEIAANSREAAIKIAKQADQQ